jgi:TupA-like ATPgrasp
MTEMTERLIFAAANALLYATNINLIRRYRRTLHRLPNVANPRIYSERMLWRKLVDHNPLFVVFSDKLAAKEFFRSRLPDLPLPRTLWTGDDADHIPDELLRGDVYVKANHGCGFNHRIRGGACDRAALREETRRWLRATYGIKGGEWSYFNVKPKLFVEEAVGDVDGSLLDFKVRAGNGVAILGLVMGHAKTPAEWMVFFDPEGRPAPRMTDPDGGPVESTPEAQAAVGPYLRAVELARRLSVGVHFARFDFLWNGRELFGNEITVYPSSGTRDPANSRTQNVLLQGWNLAQSHFLKSKHTGLKGLYANALNRQWNGCKQTLNQ